MWEQIVTYLVTKGDLGVTILISGGIILYLHKAWREEVKGRLEDNKAMLPVIEATKTTLATVATETASRTMTAQQLQDHLKALREAQERTAARIDRMHELAIQRIGQ